MEGVGLDRVLHVGLLNVGKHKPNAHTLTHDNGSHGKRVVKGSASNKDKQDIC